MNAASMTHERTLTVNHDGGIDVPPSLVENLRLQPGQQVDVVSDGRQLRITSTKFHGFADWREISHQLLDEQDTAT